MRLLLGIGLSLLVVLAACDNPVQADLDNARVKWSEAAIANYAFDLYDVDYLHPPPTHITVQNGRVTGVAAILPSPVTGRPLSQAPTIEGLFDDIDSKLRGENDITWDVSVMWDPTLGLPLHADFHDCCDLWGFRVVEFHPAP